MNFANLAGGPLSEKDYEALAASFVPRDLADAANLRRISDLDARQLFGINGRPGDFSGLLFPYVDPESGQVTSYRIRRDQPDLEERDGRVVEKAKYLSARGDRNHLYVPPWIPKNWLEDPELPLVVVEGEKKTIAMFAVSGTGTLEPRLKPTFIPVGLSGVWNWRGRIGKSTRPDGSRADIRGVIPDLRRLAVAGRKVTILFDSNAHSNTSVREARHQLAGWLSGQGAHVRIAELPGETGINGPDDAAYRHGAAYVLDILAKATPIERSANLQPLSAQEAELVRQEPYGGFLLAYQNMARGCLAEVPLDYHVLIGLVLMGGILGGKLSTNTGLRPNLAGVIVAFQGAGKSYPSVIARKLIEPIERERASEWKSRLKDRKAEFRKLENLNRRDSDKDPANLKSARDLENLWEQIAELERGGRPAIVLATQVSVEGLLEALAATPSGIADFDEFGAFLKECGRDHMRSARENLIKALDCRPIFYRRARKQSVDAPSPCLSLWGTVNVESLRAAANDEDMFGGLFSRLLFCASDYEFAIPRPNSGDSALISQLRDTIRTWCALGDIQVEFDPCVEDRATQYAYSIAPFSKGEVINVIEPEDQVAAVAYVRYRAHALRVAILIAASEEENIKGILQVGLRHIVLAINLVEGFRRQALRLFRHLEKRDPLVRDLDILKAKIRRHPGQDRSHYQRLMHWPATRFDRALVELERLGEVDWQDEGSTGGRKRRMYFPLIPR